MKTKTTLRSAIPGSNPETTSSKTSLLHRTLPFKLKRILVPVDFSDSSLRALDYALALAESVQATIIVLHVVEPAVHAENYLAAPSGLDEANQKLLETGRDRLDAVTRKRTNSSVLIEPLVRMGHAHSEIIDTAKAMGADWIVLASHGDSGHKNLVMGSTAERIVRTAPCPVLTVRLPDATS